MAFILSQHFHFASLNLPFKVVMPIHTLASYVEFLLSHALKKADMVQLFHAYQLI